MCCVAAQKSVNSMRYKGVIVGTTRNPIVREPECMSNYVCNNKMVAHSVLSMYSSMVIICAIKNRNTLVLYYTMYVRAVAGLNEYMTDKYI